MADTSLTPRTILLNVRNRHEKDYPLASENSPILPGMIVELNANRHAIPHDQAAAVPKPFFVAVEMPIRSGADIDTWYDVTGEVVPIHAALSGDDLYMMLEAGENIAKGDNLESSGNGYLRAATSGAIVRAKEAVNNPGYDGKRIRVEVL
jgi:hypothetical protein